jgi:HK97 family phage prohead protease
MKTRNSPRRTAKSKRTRFEQTFAQYSVKRSKGGVLWVSTDKTPDRDGEVVIPNGAVLDAFDANPILLFGHDHSKPIGKVLDYQVGEERNTFVPEFAKSSQDALAIKGLVDDGVLKATSIGFLPMALGEPIYEGQVGNTYAKWELLEQSIVSVPSNRNALVGAAKRMKSVAAIAGWFGMPEVERAATKTGFVRGFRFETVDEVIAFAKRHEERELELAYTKEAEGHFKGTTAKSGDGDGHEHSFVVAIEDGAVTIGKTSEVNGHSHDISEIGMTGPGGEDGHTHEWALSPDEDDREDQTEPAKSVRSSATKRAQEEDTDDDLDEDLDEEDEGEDEDEDDAEEEDEDETGFDSSSDADLYEVFEEVANEMFGLNGGTN